MPIIIKFQKHIKLNYYICILLCAFFKKIYIYLLGASMPIYSKSKFLTILTFILSSFAFSDPTNGCELNENELFLTSSGDVLYNIPTDIAGIQFDIDGATASAASGGEAAGAGFVLQTAGSTVLGISFSGGIVTTDCGTLLSLTLVGDASGLSGMTFADSSANNIPVIYYEGVDCQSGIYDCAGICDCTSVEDCA
jgi:hypothetical protein